MRFPFSPFPVLNTERLTLRALSLQDTAGVFDIRSDPVLTKYVGFAAYTDIKQAENYIRKVEAGLGKWVVWSIIEKQSGSFAGTICLWHFNRFQKSAEIGYDLLSKFQHSGIMTEAAIAVLHYGFEQMKVDSITADLQKENSSSIKLLEKLGFSRTSDYFKNGHHMVKYHLKSSVFLYK